MNRLIILLLNTFTISACQSQGKVDLEQLHFKTEVKAVMKDKKYISEHSEMFTTLPACSSDEISPFSFGPVTFTDGGAEGPQDIIKSSISFLLAGKETNNIVGVNLKIEKTKEAKMLFDYVMRKYGKPFVLAPEPTSGKNGNAAYLWKDIKNHQGILLINQYVERNHKQIYGVRLFIMDDKIKTAIAESTETVLNYLVKSIN